MKPFLNYRNSYYLKTRVKNPNILAGEFSYYCGYHHGERFEDQVWLLDEAPMGEDGDKLIIGKFCVIGSGAIFLMGGNQGHRRDWISGYPIEILEGGYDVNKSKAPKGYQQKGDTVIGNDVWIGAEAMIMPGVKIGNGAVITTRAVVIEDVPPYAIVRGNPAKKVEMRFTDSEIKKLEEIAWWDWPIEKVRKNISLLRSGDIEKLASLEK